MPGAIRGSWDAFVLASEGKCVLRFLLHDLLVLFGGEEVGFVCGAEFDDPALTVGVLVDVLGRIFECGVDLDDLAAHRGVQVGDGLDALDGAEGLAGVEGAPSSGNSTKTTSPSSSWA